MARDTTITETIAENRMETSTADLQKQIITLKDDIAELTSAVAQYGRAQTAALKAQAKDGLRMVQERGSDGLAQAGEYAGKKYAETEDYVRANPATSVGVAAALGFLVGLLTARR